MKKIKYYIFSFFFTSCITKNECNIRPITHEEFNINEYKGNFIFENQNGETDTLFLVNYINILTEKSIKSISNYEKCSHLIEMDYKLTKKNGTLEIRLEKDENENFIFKIGGICMNKELNFNKNDLKKDSIFIVKAEPFNKTRIKEIAFKKLKIYYIKTLDGDLWFPREFISNSTSPPLPRESLRMVN